MKKFLQSLVNKFLDMLHIKYFYKRAALTKNTIINDSDITLDGFALLTEKQKVFIDNSIRYDIEQYVSKGKVLDFGCGTGRHTSLFKNSDYICVGIDISKEAIRRAKLKEPGLSFEVVDILKNKKFILENKSNFSLIYSYSVIQYFQRHELEELIKIFSILIVKNGIINLFFPTSDSFIKKWQSATYRRYYIYDITRLLKKYNFEILSVNTPHQLLNTAQIVGRSLI